MKDRLVITVVLSFDDMGDVAALEHDALHFARVAVECDGRGDYDQAKFFYMVCTVQDLVLVIFKL